MNIIREARLSPSDIKRELEASRKRDEKEKEKKERKKESKKYRKEIRAGRKYKERRLAWQMSRSRQKDRERAEIERKRLEAQKKGPKTEVISSKDTDPTATRKGISNLLSVGGALARLGTRALTHRIRQKQEEQPPSEEGGNKKGKKKFKKMKKKVEAAMRQSQRLLPPASSSEFEKTDKTKITPPGSGRPVPQMSRPFTVSQRVRMSRRVLPSSINRPSSGGMAPIPKPEPTQPVNTEPRPETAGQKARRNLKFRRKLIRQRGTPMEEFSCWREEFLFELGTLRKNIKNKKTIDIMKRGKNKVVISPSVTEDFNHYEQIKETTNTASIFAKATPPLKKRTTPMSDVYLSGQPGRGTAETVQQKMRKLFLGDRSDFTTNYDLSRNDSKRHIIPHLNKEAYDEDDGTFRHHSSGTTLAVTSPGQSQTRRTGTSAVLRAMAAMNKDVVPPKKKKKKKKKDTQEQ